MFYSLGQIFRHRAMRKAVKCKIYVTLVKPVVVYGSETWTMTDRYEKTEYMGEENIEEVIWTSGRARNMENQK